MNSLVPHNARPRLSSLAEAEFVLLNPQNNSYAKLYKNRFCLYEYKIDE